jgi:hypothetical protein
MRFISLFALAAGCGSAPDKKLDTAVAQVLSTHATNRTYIQTDKPLYQPGETIWFRADLRATKTFTANGPPTGVMMQLLNPRGAIVVQKRVLAQAGVARNDFALGDAIEGGEYTIEMHADSGAVDRKKIIVNTYEAPHVMKSLELLRKAYGEGDAVTAAVELKRTTGEVMSHKKFTAVATVDDAEVSRTDYETDGSGKATVKLTLPAHIARGDGLLSVMVEEGGVTESIQRRIPIIMTTLQLGVFPEGGDLVNGIASSVYFMAKTPIGKPADIEGRVVDDQKREVATFASLHDGMGHFDIAPQAGRTYHVEITKPANITTRVDLPVAHAEGCVIHAVEQQADSVRIATTCTTKKHLGIEATLRETRVAGGSFDTEAGKSSLVELPVPRTEQGAVRVTLFDGKQPVAERLVYHGMGANLKVTLTPDKKQYAPRDKVAMHVHTTDGNGHPVKASIALAVVDDTVISFADDKSARILAHLYLEPELGATAADPIEEPNFYFSDKPDAAGAMDALLATRGYRRFEWRLQ